METFPLLWRAMLFIICLIMGEFVCSIHAQLVDCNASDREVLLDFKNGLEDSANQLSSWQGSNCCQWWGITCDNTTGAVSTVDLHNPRQNYYDSSGRYEFWNLGGEIRPTLTKLKSLRYLDLSLNTFNGRIPNFLSSLENLQYLNLSYAGFSGAIPPNLGNLSSLQFLDLSFLDLTVDNLEWVTSLVSLEHLAMSAVNLSKVGVGWVETLNKLPFLSELHLSGCFLPPLVHSLPSVNFTSLSVLDLKRNWFSSKFPNWLVNISSLVFIDMSVCNLYGRVPFGFSELPNLQYLYLGSNLNLSASSSQLFSGRWKKIKEIDFDGHLIGRLPASVGNMTSLIELWLSGTGLVGGIPSSIGRLCNLQAIHLSGNNLTGGLPEFLEETKNCPRKGPLPNLKTFVSIQSQLAGKLPNWLGKLKNLVELDLSHNLLHGPIPDLGNLQHLSLLRLNSNKLNGSLPYSLGQLSHLSFIDLSINQLNGVISEKHFSRLSKLDILSFSANSFILNVISNWVPPFQIAYLHMASCQLGPSFPAWIRSQKNIRFLDLSNASIYGSIPNWFWDISSNLSALNISFNHLEGHLPNPLPIAQYAHLDFRSNLFNGSIPLPSAGIDLLDLSNNQFSGSIPNDIGQIMPGLIFLSLSNNKLTDVIPKSIGVMSTLKILDLSRNNLIGSIPSSIGNCSSLAVLDLQNNNLSGKIPSSLGYLNLLKTLHLSDNRFSGEIPSTLWNLSSLETMDFGNNRLTGSIPPWIAEALTNLRILRLRSNTLSGELPSTLANLSSLQVLDLAENKLNGSIPGSIGDLKAMTKQEKVNYYLLYGYFEHYYQENINVIMNGLELQYTKTISLLTSIDLSGNNLCGELPEEIVKLVGLVVLNLSRNHISGQIPNSISELQQLLSLDLSSNRLSGPIPPTMSSLTFLGYLNLSNNNLSGAIPVANQMNTFTSSSFAGNTGLCGGPLAVKCLNNDSEDRITVEADNSNSFIDKWFYLSIGVGFAVGLLVPYFIFSVKRSWGGAYFAFVDRIVVELSSVQNRTATRRRTLHNF